MVTRRKKFNYNFKSQARPGFRSFKKSYRRLGRQKTRYDNGVSLKVHQMTEMVYPGTGSLTADVNVSWSGAVGGVASTLDLTFATIAEFNSMRALYSEYRVTGLKISVYKGTQDSTKRTGPVAMGSIPVISLGHATTDSVMQAAQDYEVFEFHSQNQNISKYFNVGKYYWSRGEKYLPTTGGGGGGLDPVFYSTAATLVRLYTDDNSKPAYVHATWYIRFKGQKA